MSMLNTPKTHRASIQLQGLLRIFPLLLLSVLALFMPSSTLLAQKDIRVTGRIVSETGLAVAKASVIVKGMSSGVTSNDNGDYEITAPSNGTLLFSYVGFTSAEIAINGRNNINVSLSTPVSYTHLTLPTKRIV